MAVDYIEQAAFALTKKFYTSDPFELCDCLGVTVQTDDIGTLKGMYVYIKRNRYIVLSDRLNPEMRRLVLAHELGHDQLHRESAKYSFIQDSDVVDLNDRTEYEANVFAVTLLIDDEEFLDLARSGESVERIAQKLKTDPNLVVLKSRLLKNRGFRITAFEHKADFLKY
ncbi:MAG: ImmA/IrrE family metallo-endopeptidase [Clostridia bacterium]|nr:ImmA/IrrE family metallo-endopeptidase [Clostridia bacterium]MBQ3868676.1 ImmA/IrrE family metallo-endopeptidase [Clostridia bacterium]MBR0159445.1 ImmA/IrrE family metallo-endopeptidase [Clostridia bacterium]MBR7063183.1 ImmA/IrrE family metallo-endopeptidase [Clostridia bacterium]